MMANEVLGGTEDFCVCFQLLTVCEYKNHLRKKKLKQPFFTL